MGRREQGDGGRVGTMGGRDEAMMLGREIVSARSSYLLTWRDDAPPVSVSRSEATGID